MNTKRKFHIKLKKAHEDSGKTAYRVWKDTGISPTTIAKYIGSEYTEADFLPATVIDLANYYQVDWRDPKVIEIVEVSEDDDTGQMKRPALLAHTA